MTCTHRTSRGRAKDLDAYLKEKGSIDITWPKSAARRKGARHGR